MTYFGDYQCPICKAFTLQGGFPQLVQNEVRQGKVQVLYKAFCTATCNGPDPSVFNTQQVAGLAAGKQNKFWQFTELFYNQQGQEDTAYVTPAYLTGLANQVSGLNLATWKTDQNDQTLTSQVTSRPGQRPHPRRPGHADADLQGTEGPGSAQCKRAHLLPAAAGDQQVS